VSTPYFERVAIFGVGLIGGSLALELRAAQICTTIVGYDSNAENLAQAVELGIVDDAATAPEDAVRGASLVILATPPATIFDVATSLAPYLEEGAIVTDVGSVKTPIVEPLTRALAPKVRFVGGHPVAGTEKSGAAAAMRDLFRGRKCILTPVTTTDPDALQAVRAIWSRIGAHVVVLSPTVHDTVCAAISHLPHVTAYALTAAIADAAEKMPEIYGLGAGGFNDTTRIASSSPQMWRDIFLLNRDAVLDAVERMESRLAELRQLIDRADSAGLEKFFAGMRDVRQRVLKGQSS